MLKIQTESGYLTGFTDFAGFVINESSEANSTYYKAIFSSRSSKNNSHGFEQKRTHTFATPNPIKTFSQTTNQAKVHRGEEKSQKEDACISCYSCGQQHKLSDCDAFANKTLQEKRSVVRERQL